MFRLSALATCASLLLLSACDAQPQVDDNRQPAPEVQGNAEEPVPATLPTVEQPLTRRDLIIAAMDTATDLVTGSDDTERQQRLDGRSISFRIRLCEGAPGQGRLAFDSEEGVLRVSVSPDLTGEDPAAAALGSDRFEAVEGFWVPYPWLLQASCPPASSLEAPKDEPAAAAEPQAPTRPTLGLAQFFPPETDRSNRREGRPFSVTRRLEQGTVPGPVDLVLRGRLSRLPGAKVINCVSSAPMLQPQCIISVRFDSVRLEQVNSGEVLGEWSAA